MLTIRLTRKGKKNQPFFRVVVIDRRRSSKGGRTVEDLGFVDPLNKRKSVNKERAQYWISKGAKPSDTIHNLLVSEKIIDAPKINLFKKSKKPVEAVAAQPITAPAEEVAPLETPVPEAPVEAPKQETPAETPKELKPEAQ